MSELEYLARLLRRPPSPSLSTPGGEAALAGLAAAWLLVEDAA